MVRKVFDLMREEFLDERWSYFSTLKPKVLLRKLLGNLYFKGISMKEYLLLIELLFSQKYLKDEERVLAIGLISLITAQTSGLVVSWGRTFKPLRKLVLTGSEKEQIPLKEVIPKMDSFDFIIPSGVSKRDLKIEVRLINHLNTRKSSKQRLRTPSAVGTKNSGLSKVLSPLSKGIIEIVSNKPEDLIEDLYSFATSILELSGSHSIPNLEIENLPDEIPGRSRKVPKNKFRKILEEQIEIDRLIEKSISEIEEL